MEAVHMQTARELARAVTQREITVTEIAKQTLERVEAVNEHLNALVYLDSNQIMKDAAALDATVQSGKALGPLHGVPYTIKDNTPIKGLPFTSGFNPDRFRVAERDAVVYARMRAAGGLFIGKTNLPEYGYYGGCDGHAFGPAHNPFRLNCITGGSSGGAAASVAAGITPLAEGNDGAGSVRIPAALCGVVGLKPSLGRIPETIFGGRYYSFIYHGTLSRDVRDAALMLDVLSGPSECDPKSIEAPRTSFTQSMNQQSGTIRALWSRDFGTGVHVDSSVVQVCEKSLETLTHSDVSVDNVTIRWGVNVAEVMWNSVWVPAFAELHDSYDWSSLNDDVDPQLIEIIQAGERLTAVEIANAQRERGNMWDEFVRLMKTHDVLITPTLTTATFEIGKFAPDWLRGRPLRNQILDWLLTYPCNLLGLPAISVPAGLTDDGRPVGLQLIGKPRTEALLLNIARRLEECNEWRTSYERLAIA